MGESEWEEVSLGELRDGEVARVVVTYEGPWDRRYGLMSRSLTSSYRYERKVAQPSPEAMRAAVAVLAHEYPKGGWGWSSGRQAQLASIIDKAYQGEKPNG